MGTSTVHPAISRTDSPSQGVVNRTYEALQRIEEGLSNGDDTLLNLGQRAAMSNANDAVIISAVNHITSDMEMSPKEKSAWAAANLRTRAWADMPTTPIAAGTRKRSNDVGSSGGGFMDVDSA